MADDPPPIVDRDPSNILGNAGLLASDVLSAIGPLPSVLSGALGTSSPAIIKEAQGDLNALGYGPLAVDGNAGPLTEAAALKFQRAKGLAVDGKIGPQTIGALRLAVVAAPALGALGVPGTAAMPVSPNAAPVAKQAAASSSSAPANLKWYAGGAALLALVGIGAAATAGGGGGGRRG